MVQGEILGDHTSLGISYHRGALKAESPEALVNILRQEFIRYDFRKRLPSVDNIDPEVVCVGPVSSDQIRNCSLKAGDVKTSYEKKRSGAFAEYGIIHGISFKLKGPFFDVV